MKISVLPSALSAATWLAPTKFFGETERSASL
jgi:hypothetical protein